jgi:peroxiredoxin Q/BCP
MLQEGKKAPVFNLPASTGKKLGLKDFAGKKLVLYFYPKDNTPGCTVEAQEFRDAQQRLEKHDAVVVGVSRDSLASHEKFIAKHALNFPLLTDETGEVLEKYGAWGEKNMYGKKMMGIIRTTVVIDEKGVVRKVFPAVRVKGHVDKVVELLETLD